MAEERSSPRRREVLDQLRSAQAPLGVAQVAAHLGVHPNTVRFHLDALVAEGAVEAQLEQTAGPGRPRTVYTARPGMDRGGARSYRLLAQMLLSQLAAAGSEAGNAAEHTGRAWGRFLVEPPPPFQQPTAERSITRLTSMLEDLGFAPRAEPSHEGASVDRIRLRRCPFLELAEEYGQLVCPLHLGLMRGALAALDAPVAATSLEPFAEPDACIARLAPV